MAEQAGVHQGEDSDFTLSFQYVRKELILAFTLKEISVAQFSEERLKISLQ